MLATACAALLVYVFTLAPGVFPGESANLMVRTLDLAPRNSAAHPFWTLLVRLVAGIPVGPLPIRLNLLSALCSAACVALFFRLTFRMLFEAARRVFWEFLPVLPSDFQDDDPDRQGSAGASNNATAPSTRALISASDRQTATAALLGAIAATLALAFSAPFWSASVSLHFQTFDLLLLLVAGSLLEAHLASGSAGLALFAAMACGAGAAESPVFLLGAPLMLFLLIRTAVIRDELSEGCVLLVLLGGASGVAGGVLAAKLSCIGQSGALLSFRELALGIAHSHHQALVQALPHVGWILLLAPTVLPGLVVLFGAKRAFAIRMQREHRLLWVLANVLFTCMVLGCLLNLSFSPWSRARMNGHLPVMLGVIVALTTGFLVTYWRLFGCTPELEDDAEEDDPVTSHASAIERLGARALCCLMLGVVAVTPVTSYRDANGRQGMFADQLAREVLARLGPHRWLASDGLLDSHIIVQARMQGRDLTVVTLAEPLTSATCQHIRHALALEQDDEAALRGAPFADTSAFLVACLIAHPEAAARGVVIDAPGVWSQAGLTPVPDELFYVCAGGDSPGLAWLTPSLLAERRACWQHLSVLLAPVLSRAPYLTMYNALLRRQISRMANDLGVLLESHQHQADADAIYGQSLQLDGDNASATLNRYALQRRCGDQDNCFESAQHVHRLSQRFGPKASLLHLTRFYGYLSRQDPALWDAQDAGSPALRDGARLRASDNLFAQWLKLCVAREAADAATPSAYARDVPGTRATDGASDAARELQAAASSMQDGRLPEAETILRRLTSQHPESLPSWSLLADALLRRGATNLVEQDVLPAMSRAASRPDDVLVQLVRAKVLGGKQPVDHAALRTLLRSVLKQQPALSAVRDDLLRLDFAQGDPAATAADAADAVTWNPHDAFANYLLAGIRLDAGEVPCAEEFARRSLAAHDTMAARTLLADALRQRRSFAESEREARRAVRDAPDFAQAWVVLGCTLFDEGRLDEAAQALETALPLRAVSPRAALTLARVRLAQGRTDSAREVLRTVSARSDRFRLEVSTLQRQLDATQKSAF